MEFLAATTASDLMHEPYLEYQETFLKIQLHQVNRRHRFRKGCCMEEILSSFDASVFLGTGKKVAQDRDEKLNNETKPTPRFARKSST